MHKKTYLEIILLAGNIFLAQNVAAERPACPDGTTEGIDCFECGVNCTAYLSNDTTTEGGKKQLNITGYGDMTDGNSYGATLPWNSYRADITNVVIEPAREDSNGNIVGITRIGNGAFSFMPIKNITIPTSVTSIGAVAFWDADLTSISIPDSVTKIQIGAFGRNQFLSAFTIPDSVSSLEGGAFDECYLSGLTTNAKNLEKYLTDGGHYGMTEGSFQNNSPVFIYCSGTESCQDTLDKWLLAKYGEDKTQYPAWYSNIRIKTTIEYQNPDGSYSVYNLKGKFLGYKGKRTYTVEEAEKLSKPTGNTFKLRYK